LRSLQDGDRRIGGTGLQRCLHEFGLSGRVEIDSNHVANDGPDRRRTTIVTDRW